MFQILSKCKITHTEICAQLSQSRLLCSKRLNFTKTGSDFFMLKLSFIYNNIHNNPVSANKIHIFKQLFVCLLTWQKIMIYLCVFRSGSQPIRFQIYPYALLDLNIFKWSIPEPHKTTTFIATSYQLLWYNPSYLDILSWNIHFINLIF